MLLSTCRITQPTIGLDDFSELTCRRCSAFICMVATCVQAREICAVNVARSAPGNARRPTTCLWRGNNGLRLIRIRTFCSVRVYRCRHIKVGLPTLNFIVSVGRGCVECRVDLGVRSAGCFTAINIVPSNSGCARVPGKVDSMRLRKNTCTRQRFKGRRIGRTADEVNASSIGTACQGSEREGQCGTLTGLKCNW